MVKRFFQLPPMQGPEVALDDLQRYLTPSPSDCLPCTTVGTADISILEVQEEHGRSHPTNFVLLLGGISQEISLANNLGFRNDDGKDSYRTNFPTFKECASIADCDDELFEEMRETMQKIYKSLNRKLRMKGKCGMPDQALTLVSSNEQLQTHQKVQEEALFL
jgi:hypothetical protein